MTGNDLLTILELNLDVCNWLNCGRHCYFLLLFIIPCFTLVITTFKTETRNYHNYSILAWDEGITVFDLRTDLRDISLNVNIWNQTFNITKKMPFKVYLLCLIKSDSFNLFMTAILCCIWLMLGTWTFWYQTRKSRRKCLLNLELLLPSSAYNIMPTRHCHTVSRK